MSELADGVVVTGVGRVSMPPDVMMAQFAAEATASGAQSAWDRCSQAVASMSAALEQGGAAESDRQTSGVSLHQAHDRHGQPRGWTASSGLTVTLRKLDRAGELISATIGAGGNEARLRSVTLGIDKSSDRHAAARVEARRLAFVDAKAAATQHAELTGRRLGVVISVREADREYPPPYPMAAGMAVMEAAAPIERGELDVTTTVEVRWGFLS